MVLHRSLTSFKMAPRGRQDDRGRRRLRGGPAGGALQLRRRGPAEWHPDCAAAPAGLYRGGGGRHPQHGRALAQGNTTNNTPTNNTSNTCSYY